ncbi:hypothetical protein TRFO_04973 [Tritrichomonas foetus]|uniref:Sialidase domain-containing protein n=1 Tax=Tritrichomonas foetus TaxID=1144522 RepID=A0A1J4KF01_9EUKA|nr:hypothetical protein TRFO_04973 [Tritrichomonas foetus]|eukprot:OHT08340.1 hypothetical protein TRFO_04973 [Tritrichomonas foetus]
MVIYRIIKLTIYFLCTSIKKFLIFSLFDLTILFCRKTMFAFLFSLCLSYDPLRESVLFQPNNWHSRYFRIPAICTANDGSLITATDARWINKNDLPARISVMIRRSPDNGRSWSDPVIISGPIKDTGHGDASIMTDRKTGVVICVYNGDNGWAASTAENPQHIYMSRSYDNGVTWEEMVDITHFLYSKLCTQCNEDRQTWAGMFATSGTICQLRDGRIMVAGNVRCHGQSRNYAIYTDDLGETWDMGLEHADAGADEAKFVERNDGIVIISVRQGGNRKFVFSPDRGDHWENETQMPDIWDSPCNGEILRYTSTIDGYDKDRMIHTVTYVKNFPRRNVSMLLSYDEGKTWPIKKQLNLDADQLGSYSSITIGKDGLIHVYYEKGTSASDPDEFNMTVSTFSLEWLTDGQDKYLPAGDLKWCIASKDDQSSTKLCPSDHYQLSSKVFDNYVESYLIYPTTVSYSFTTQVRDFTINLSREGLTSGSYKNEVESLRPTVTIIGHSNNPRTFEFKNVNLVVSADELVFNTFILDDVTLKVVNTTNLSNVEIGTTKVRFTKLISPSSSVLSLIDVEKSIVEIQNDHSDEPLLITHGISGVQTLAGAQVRLVAAAESTSQLHIVGEWYEDEGRRVTIVTPEGKKTRVLIDKKNIGKFVIEGATPEYVETPDNSIFSRIAEKSKYSKVSLSSIIFVVVCAASALIAVIAMISYFIQKKHTSEYQGV